MSTLSKMLILFMIGQTAFSQEKYEYPELLVSPSAYETLVREAKQEQDQRWLVHLPSQVPALLNLVTGLRAKDEKHPDESDPQELINFQEKISGRANLAMSVGLGWIGLTAGFSALYSPYQQTYLELRKNPPKSRRDKLMLQRHAEEALEDAAITGRRLDYIGSIINLAASIPLLSATEDRQTKVQGVFTVLSCFLPILLKSPWATRYDRYQDYKKRIYSPIVDGALIPSSQGLSPVLSLTWQLH